FRRAQGRLETLRDVRYIDLARIDELSETVQAELHDAGKGAVEFLQGDGAFTGYHAEVERIAEDARTIGTAADAAPLAALLDAQNERSEEHTSELQSRENLVCR